MCLSRSISMQAHLWLNNRDGTFREVDAGYFKPSDRHDCLAADFNADGREDIFCSIGTDRGTALKSNELYIQQPDHTFTEQAYQWFVSDPAGRGRNSAVLDANNDGYPDLFSGTAALRSDGLPSPNRLYLNTGHGSMLDSPAMGLDLDIGSRCAHTVDYNSDGWPDLARLRRRRWPPPVQERPGPRLRGCVLRSSVPK